jgi:hypothetical protein
MRTIMASYDADVRASVTAAVHLYALKKKEK